MDFKQALAMLLESSRFKTWKKKNRHSFLSYGFFETGQSAWQIGFYHPKKDRITSFIIEYGDISIVPNQEIFKSGEIKRLIPEKIKVDATEALNKAKRSIKSVPLKAFLLIQSKGTTPYWNVTLLTPSSTINIHIDSSTGKIISSRETPLFEYVQDVNHKGKEDKKESKAPDYIL